MKSTRPNCAFRMTKLSLLVSLATSGLTTIAVAEEYGVTETSSASSAATTEGSTSVGQSTQSLAQALPTARIHTAGERIVRLYGQAMATGISPEAAADEFRVKAAGALGAIPGEVQLLSNDGTKTLNATGDQAMGLMVNPATGEPKFYLYRYGQVRGNVPVHDAELLTLVKNEAGYPVVWASSTLRDLKDFSPGATTAAPKIDEVKARAAIAAYAGAAAKTTTTPSVFARFEKAEYVIFAGADDRVAPPRLAVRYVAGNDDPPAKMRFVADSATNEILHAADLIPAANVSGTVRGISTVGPKAWDATDSTCATTASTAFPYANVSLSSGATGFTTSNGSFTLSNAGASAVTVVSPVSGKHFNVVDLATANESLSLTVTPPNNANFLHNQSNTQEYIRSQSIAYVHSNRVRDFLLSYLPAYPGVSNQLNFKVEVNFAGDGCPNSWGSIGGLRFCQQTGASKNTAFGALIYHEYAHVIVAFGGSGQEAYGEGMADAISTALDEVPGFAYGWNTSPCTVPLRWVQNTCQYDATACTSNCGTEIHACGRLLSGIIWDIRSQLKITHPTDYRDIMNAIMFSSIPMHSGTAIDGRIAVDFLTLDDNDGNLDNGTPHRAEICAGFAAHGIDCPALPNSRPCSRYCANPLVFSWSGSYQSGQLGTGLVCRETTQAVHGGNCGGVAAGRQLFVNGQTMACNTQNWTSIPAAVNGGYCVTTTAGNYTWAAFALW